MDRPWYLHSIYIGLLAWTWVIMHHSNIWNVSQRDSHLHFVFWKIIEKFVQFVTDQPPYIRYAISSTHGVIRSYKYLWYYRYRIYSRKVNYNNIYSNVEHFIVIINIYDDGIIHWKIVMHQSSHHLWKVSGKFYLTSSLLHEICFTYYHIPRSFSSAWLFYIWSNTNTVSYTHLTLPTKA